MPPNSKMSATYSSFYLLPCNESVKCEDPLSITGNFDSLLVKKWDMIQFALNDLFYVLNSEKTSVNEAIDAIIETISYFDKTCDQSNYSTQRFESLKAVFIFLKHKHSNIFNEFIHQTLPKCIEIALQMPQLFPKESLPFVTKVLWSMFLCVCVFFFCAISQLLQSEKKQK